MGYFIIAILGISLVFIFPGVISYLALIFGFLFNISLFPIEFINGFIYPVGIIVYITVYIFYAYLIYKFIRNNLV